MFTVIKLASTLYQNLILHFSMLFILDCFVKVYLLQNGKKICKKKTSMKRDDPNPIFNEAMIFSVPATMLPVGEISI